MYYKLIKKQGDFIMKKSIFFILSVTILTLTSANAAIYKGQREFKKNCVSCHSNGQELLAKHTIAEWDIFTKDKGEALKKLHANSEKAKKSQKYFESKKYTKKLKHLRQFVIEYAKDSGNTPACD